MGAVIPAPKKLGSGPRRVPLGGVRRRGGLGFPPPGESPRPARRKPYLRRLRPRALDDDASRVGGIWSFLMRNCNLVI